MRKEPLDFDMFNTASRSGGGGLGIGLAVAKASHPAMTVRLRSPAKGWAAAFDLFANRSDFRKIREAPDAR
jgi:hypothetical protein